MVELGICDYSQSLQLTKRIDFGYIEHNSIRNDKCKFSKINSLSEFSRTLYDQNNDYFDQDAICNERDGIEPSFPNESYVVPLMSVDVSPCKFQNFTSQVERSKMQLLKYGSLSNEVRDLNENVNQSFLKINSKSRKLSRDDSYEFEEADQFGVRSRKRLSETTNQPWVMKLGVKRSKINKIAKKFDYVERDYDCQIPIGVTESQNQCKETGNDLNQEGICNGNIELNIIDKDLYNSAYVLKNDMNDGLEMLCGFSDKFMKFDVFDYGHRPVDVSNLSVVEPALKNDRIDKLNESSVNLDCLENLELSTSRLAHEEKLVFNKISLRNDKWELIPLISPLRVKLSIKDVNLQKCSHKDPRIKHLFE